MKCYLFDLDLDPMTFIFKLHLEIKLLASAVHKLQPEHVHRQNTVSTGINTFPHFGYKMDTNLWNGHRRIFFFGKH